MGNADSFSGMGVYKVPDVLRNGDPKSPFYRSDLAQYAGVDARNEQILYDRAQRYQDQQITQQLGQAQVNKANALADLLKRGVPDFYSGSNPGYVSPQMGQTPAMPPRWFMSPGSYGAGSGSLDGNRLAQLLGGMK